MTFPLESLAAAVTARDETWARLEMVWHARPAQSNFGKTVVSSQLECASWLAEIMIWGTGEAELGTVRLADGRTVNKHYELAGRADLEVLLDELIALFVEDELPSGAVVGRWVEPPA